MRKKRDRGKEIVSEGGRQGEKEKEGEGEEEGGGGGKRRG